MTPAALRRITEPQSPFLLPRMCFAGLPAGAGLDAFRSRHGALIGAAVPYWAIAWPGGQALARWLLDNPGQVAGRCVVDIGCGAGLVAAAAMLSGAREAIALDPDPNALIAAAETARLNGVAIAPRPGGLETLELEPPQQGALLCAADLWYEPHLARQATVVLTRLAQRGAQVLCGDQDRPGRPRQGIAELARHEMPGHPEFDGRSHIVARVLALSVPDILPAHCPPAANRRDAGPALE